MRVIIAIMLVLICNLSNADFPSTPIIDDFNRANAGDLGANWTMVWDDAGVEVNSNVSKTTVATGAFESSAGYWNQSVYGPAVEAYVTIPALIIDEVYDLFVLFNPVTYDYYKLRADTWVDVFQLFVSVGGIETQLGADVPYTFVAGDKFGLRVQNGELTIFLKQALGPWTIIAKRYDSTITTPGYNAVGWYGNAVGVTLDDVGGGTIAPLDLKASNNLNVNSDVKL